jgi:hypothetical protein
MNRIKMLLEKKGLTQGRLSEKNGGTYNIIHSFAQKQEATEH